MNNSLSTFDESRPKTIAFLGTSRERGVMQTIGAMLMNYDEKMGKGTANNTISAKYQQSNFMSCRGEMSIQVNGLKVLYRDIRINTGGLDEKDGTMTCHGPNIASYDGYLKNATKMMTKVCTQEDGKSTECMLPSICFLNYLSTNISFLCSSFQLIPLCFGLVVTSMTF